MSLISPSGGAVRDGNRRMSKHRPVIERTHSGTASRLSGVIVLKIGQQPFMRSPWV